MLQIGRKKLRFTSASVNAVFDGNSLVAGVGASNAGHYITALMAGLFPLSGSGVTVQNLGVAGQTWVDMNQYATDVDGAYVAGKANVLFLWETTNSVWNTGRTTAQTIADMRNYINNRLAANPGWKIIVLTALPREGRPSLSAITQDQRDTFNLTIDAVNSALKANYKAWGIKGVVDVRQEGSPFAFSNYLPASWDASGAYWYDAAPFRVHLTDAGYALIAKWCNRAAANLTI